jgi:ATP-binding cassette subfamily F protein 3
MAVAIASDLAKDMAGEPLMRGVSFKLERRDRLTLSGRNGAGKTTLLRMLAGETGVDGGELSFAKGARISLHDQRPPRDRDVTLRDYVLSGCKELLAIEERLGQLEQRMAAGDMESSTLDAYARAQARLEHAGGYTWRDTVFGTVHGLGFRDQHLDRRLSTFSGGELTRASLARALAGDPDLLLLDEPTNHLDIESLEWLEAYLQSVDAAVVLVAHDRWFLEAVGNAVLELEGGRGRFFKGTWHTWRQEKAARELALGRAIDKQEAEVARLARFVERFSAGTRARQAQSRVKQLEKIDRLDHDPRDGKALGFAFKPPERSGRVVFELEDAALRIGDRTLVEDAELWLERGEHVSLVGANGTGKTTLISVLAGERELDGGKLRRGHNVKVGLLSQHAEELDLATGPAGSSATVAEVAQRATGLTPNHTRSLLGQFLFSGEAAEKPIGGLSGGERRRLSLAILVHSGANVLILDEPTNHLDLESREALEAALQQFQGAVLLISHDRALLDAVGSRTVSVEDGTLRSYVGGWPEYVRVREERRADETRAKKGKPAEAKKGKPEEIKKGKPADASQGKPSGAKKGKPADGKQARSREAGPGAPAPKLADGRPSKNQQRQVRRVESEIERAEAELAAIEAELADPGAWNDPRSAAKSTQRHTDAKAKVEALYAELELLAG